MGASSRFQCCVSRLEATLAQVARGRNVELASKTRLESTNADAYRLGDVSHSELLDQMSIDQIAGLPNYAAVNRTGFVQLTAEVVRLRHEQLGYQHLLELSFVLWFLQKRTLVDDLTL